MWPLIELFLIFGPVMAFCLWQIRVVRRSREQSANREDADSKVTESRSDAPR